MKHKRNFLIMGIIAIVLTSVLYRIDADPPYPEFKKTIIEFATITGIVFGLISLIYLLISYVKKLRKTSHGVCRQ